MNEIVIDVTDQGVESMHFDRFNLGFLGKMHISRASEIFFNEDSQEWDIRLPRQIIPYPCAMGFKNYEDARDFEIEWLQMCRKHSVNPLSEAGEGICSAIRYSDLAIQ
jgi:hypothetical protein